MLSGFELFARWVPLNYVAKNWAVVMMLKALLLAHFSSALLLKYKLIIDQARAKFAQKIPTKSVKLAKSKF